MQDDDVASTVALSYDLATSVGQARQELSSMPFFVRPMVKRGFRKRTGKTMEEWERLCRDIASRLESGDRAVVQRRGLIADLERLKENFRTAPERAERGMGGNRQNNQKVMGEIKARSRQRTELIDELVHALARVSGKDDQ